MRKPTETQIKRYEILMELNIAAALTYTNEWLCDWMNRRIKWRAKKRAEYLVYCKTGECDSWISLESYQHRIYFMFSLTYSHFRKYSSFAILSTTFFANVISINNKFLRVSANAIYHLPFILASHSPFYVLYRMPSPCGGYTTFINLY